jgi:hypothetical protein
LLYCINTIGFFSHLYNDLQSGAVRRTQQAILVQDNALPVPISLPPPPAFPENFNELPPAKRQDHLLAAGMYLQAHLLNLSVKLAPEDAKAIAQLASVAQAVVGNSIKLEQIKVEREDNQEKVAAIIERVKAAMNEMGRG